MSTRQFFGTDIAKIMKRSIIMIMIIIYIVKTNNFMNKRISDFTSFASSSKVNEIFGFSKAERNAKALKENAAKAKSEISAYNFNNLFKEQSDDADNKKLMYLVDIALKVAKDSMPSLAMLMPDLFVRQGGTGAVSADLDWPSAKYGKLHGIVPANFSFLLDGGELLGKEAARDRMSAEVDRLLEKI